MKDKAQKPTHRLDEKPNGHHGVEHAQTKAAPRSCGSQHGQCSGLHGHADHLGDSRGDTKRLAIALAVIAGFAVIEVAGGVISGSLALLADAGHMVMDGIALGIALFARHLAAKPASRQFPFGQKRAQVLAAFVNGLALFAVVVVLMGESVQRLNDPREISAGLMMTVAVLGLLANLVAFWILHSGDTQDVNMRGAILHVVSDILGSVAAIVSAIVIMTTGWFAVDALVTMVVCALIARSAWGLVKETGIILLQGAPPGLNLEQVENAIRTQVSTVAAIDNVRAWMLTPDTPQLTMTVVVDSPDVADETCQRVKSLLKEQFGIEDSTVELSCHKRLPPIPFQTSSQSKGRDGSKQTVAAAMPFEPGTTTSGSSLHNAS
ncbi:MAG: cation diffusion facilitator family transporter [Pseudomonadota bacterium]